MTEQNRPRVIAVEEHFATETFRRRTTDAVVFAGEEDELAWARRHLWNDAMWARMADVDVRLAEMDAAGVDLAVLSLNPPAAQLYADTAFATSLAHDLNDELATLIEQCPRRLAGLATVAPQDPQAAAEEIRRAVRGLGLNGVLVGSHTGGHYLDEPEYEPILAALEGVDATLYLHPRMPSPSMLEPFKPYGLEQALWGFQVEASTHAVRLIMSGALDRHPNLRIVLGHLGEGIPFWLWRLDNLREKMFAWGREMLHMVPLELAPSEYFRRNFSITTSGLFDPKTLEYCIAQLGAERVLFAVDYPYESNVDGGKFLRDAQLRPDQRELISHRNAERLFKL